MRPLLVTIRAKPDHLDEITTWITGEDDEDEDALRLQRAFRKAHQSGAKWYVTLEGSEPAVRRLVENVLRGKAEIERSIPIHETWSSHGRDDDDDDA